MTTYLEKRRTNLRLLGTAVSAICVLGFVSSAQSLTIDTFMTPQQDSGPEADGLPSRSAVTGDMFGGRRSMTVGGQGVPGSLVTGIVESGSFSLFSSGLGQDLVDIGWSRNLPTDLTENGAMSAFRLNVGAFTASMIAPRIQMSVVSSGPGFNNSRLSYLIQTTGPVEFAFEDFTAFGTAGAADFSEITTISIRLQSEGNITLTGGLATIPEPSAGLLIGLGLLGLGTRGRQGA